MRMYLHAESENGIGYMPNCLKIKYAENGERLELTLDVQGETDADLDRFDCRCKGLVPWALWNYETGEETDLDLMSEDELNEIMPDEKIAEIVCKSDNFVVGIYPFDDSDDTYELVKSDKLSYCEGVLEMYVGDKYVEKYFEFEAELIFC